MKKIKKGDVITFEGCGISPKGHNVFGGRSVKTGKKMKVKTLTKFFVTGWAK